MNAIFNFDRFKKIITRSYFLSRMQYRYIAGTLIGIYFLSMLLCIIIGSSLSGLIFFGACIVVVGAPCLFERPISRNGSIFDFILPASTFEKFLSLWLKYVIFLPALVFLIIFFLNLITGIIPIEGIQKHAELMTPDLSDHGWYTYYISLLSMQSLFLLGYLYFRKYLFAKTSLIIMAFLIIMIVLVSVSAYAVISENTAHLSEVTAHYDTAENQKSFVMGYSFGKSIAILEKPKSALLNIINIVQYVVMTLGMWVVAFFKMRETEI